VGENFLQECVDSETHWEEQEMKDYLLWGEERRKREIEETKGAKFIQKMGVAMDSDVGELKDKAHVLVDLGQKCVYSEMLSKTDIASGSNSFYTLHLLEADDASTPQYWVFRKWGRIGVSQGGTKVEDFGGDQAKAINLFKKLYAEKSGNPFGLKGDSFFPKAGFMNRVDVEHEALTNPNKKAKKQDAADGDAVGSDQPLGKLTQKQIHKGDGVLDKIESILNAELKEEGSTLSSSSELQVKGFSAEYYSLIPHNFGKTRPPPINTPDLLGSEKALLSFYLRMGFEEVEETEVKLMPISGVMKLKLADTLKEACKGICPVKDVVSCVKKGDKMHKKKAGKPLQPMTPDLYGSILLYTSNAIYKELNKCLRDEDRAKVMAYFPYLRTLFEACARLPSKPCTLWRGLSVDLSKTYVVGSVIIWWGVSSCTSDKKVAEDFMNGCGDGASFLEIETTTACEISEVSFYQNEAESILLPGTQLQVLSNEKKGSKAYIKLKEVGRLVD